MDTIEMLKQMLHEQFGIERQAIDADARLADYELDSLSLAEFVFTIDDSFHVDFPDDLRELKTLRDVAQKIDALPRKIVLSPAVCAD